MAEDVAMQRIRTICLAVLATGVLCAGLYYLKAALVPFVIAALLHFSLIPLIEIQRKRLKFPRWLAVVNTALVGAVAVGLVWLMLASSVAQIAANIDQYGERLQGMLDYGIERAPLEMMGVAEDEVEEAVNEYLMSSARGILPGTVGLAFDMIGQGALVFLFLMFMIAGKAVGTEPEKDSLMYEVEHRINRYVLAKFCLSALTGFVTWLILALFGVEFAMVFGVMAFLLNFIPNIGSIIAGLLPVPVILLGDYSITVSILAIGLPMLAQFCIGNLLEPKVMGKSLGMHPVVVLLSLVLFGLLWGIPGMFLAVPMAAILKIVLNKRPFTRPIARLMEGDLNVLDENLKTRILSKDDLKAATKEG
jgi:AI-2 transport protein TqsA